MGSKAPPAPNYQPLMQAQMAMAQEQAQVSREQLAWAKETWKADRAFQDQIFSITKPILEAEAAFATKNAGTKQELFDLYAKQAKSEGAFAERQRQRWETEFKPIEDQFMAEAKSYDSPERIEANRARAMGEVSDQFDAARKNAASRLESYGVDPGQTRAAALDTGIRLQEAATKVAASEGSRLQTEATGRALRGEAINIGRGYPGQVAQAYGTANAGGAGGMGAIGGSMQAGVSGLNGLSQARGAQSAQGSNMMGGPTQWGGLASNNYANAGNTMFQGYNAQLNEWKANQASMQGVGGAFGSLLGFGLGFANKGGKLPDDPIDPRGQMDRFNIAVAGGEHVIPTSVVKRLGSDHFDKLIMKFGSPDEAEAAAMRIKTGKPGGEKRAPSRQSGAIPLSMG
jgi:hypothetical protein